MQSRYFIMSELAAIAHDMDLLLAQLNDEQEQAEKRDKKIAVALKGKPISLPTQAQVRAGYDPLDKELLFLQQRFNALCNYYTEEVLA